MKPSKARSTERIDGLVAAIMGVAVLTAPHDVEPEYESAYAGLSAEQILDRILV